MLGYCGDLVRRYDPDRFLLSLFAPADARADLWALYSFNHEIAKTREVVTETQLGLIRLQWWRDAIAAIYEGGQMPEHQIIQPLAAAIKRYNLPRDLFDHLIYAREFDLEDRLPTNLEGLVKYADFTSTPLLNLSLLCHPSASLQDNSIDKIATAYALVGLLRAVPAHARQRRCYMPEDLLQAQGITAYDLYDGQGFDKLQPVFDTVIAKIDELLKTDTRSKPLLLMRKLAELHRKALPSRHVLFKEIRLTLYAAMI